jgi:hypothetical protein
MKYLFSLVSLFLYLASYTQDNNLLPERTAFKLKLPVNKNSVYEMDVPSSPFVRNKNIVQIYPGETLFLEATIQDSVIRLTSVKDIKHPEKTITISLVQNATKKTHENMMLKVSNPFDKDLTYAARIFLMEANKWVSTSVLPVRAGISSFEMWPDVIITIGLSDWKFISSNS